MEDGNVTQVLEDWADDQKVIDMVRQEYPDVAFPKAYLAPASYGRRKPVFVPGAMAIVGKVGEDEVHYGWCTENYKLIPHEVVVARVASAIRKVEGFGQPTKPSVALIDPTQDETKPGARLLVSLSWPESIREFKGRQVCPSISVKSSYDLGWDFRLMFRAIVQVCTNGMVAYKIMQTLHSRHRLSLDIENLLGQLTEGMGQYEMQVTAWEKWAETDLTPPQFKRLWDKFPFGKRYEEKVMELTIKGPNVSLKEMVLTKSINAYYVYAAATQFITHEIQSPVAAEEYSEEVAKAMTNFFNGTNGR
jgi:hypothetical protein